MRRRHLVGRLWMGFFYFSIGVGLGALVVLLLQVVDNAYGLVGEVDSLNVRELTNGRELEELSKDELVQLVDEGLAQYPEFRRAQQRRILIRQIVNERLIGLTNQEFGLILNDPVKDHLAPDQYPDELADEAIGALSIEQYLQILDASFDEEGMRLIVSAEVVRPRIARSFNLFQSLRNREALEKDILEDLATAKGSDGGYVFGPERNWIIEALIARPDVPAEFKAQLEALEDLDDEEVAAVDRQINALIEENDALVRDLPARIPTLSIYVRSWLSLDFLINPLDNEPEVTGMRTPILGSLWMVFLTALFAIPLGVGAAIYLEEYATDNAINRLIQTNIYNLAGVPSIIYGLLGLAVFVRVLGDLTSGTIFGFADPTTANGRTVLSGSLTMALLVLPIIIIASQEAIRAVPSSLRQASY
ncbi:MAG: hypothetical protein HC915_01825, partial [Anaerolineae bacterium]|nr:hypothetical protein [Anaerolineae bacterium]